MKTLTDQANTPDSTNSPEYNKWWRAVSEKPAELKRVPKHLITYNLCLQAVRKSGFAIEHVPSHIIDGRLITIAMKRDGMALEYLPMYLRSKVVCTYACEADGRALKYVPAQLLDELAPQFLEKNGQLLKSIKNAASPELVAIAVEADPLALQYVNRDMQNYELVLSAVSKNGEALQYVNHALFSDELVETALAHDRFGWVGQCLPKVWYNKYRDQIKMFDIDIPEFILNTIKNG